MMPYKGFKNWHEYNKDCKKKLIIEIENSIKRDATLISLKELSGMGDEIIKTHIETHVKPRHVQFYPESLVLWIYDDAGKMAYELDLERCNTVFQILDWLVQISGKRWATNEILGEILQVLDLLLDIQGNCRKQDFNAKLYLKPSAFDLSLKAELLHKYLKDYSKRKGVFTYNEYTDSATGS